MGLIDDFIKWLISLFRTVKLTITVTGGGTTTPSVGVHSYRVNSSVSVRAAPAEGWRFSHWEGDLTGASNPDVVSMSVNKTIIAVFERETYQVSAMVSPAEGGQVTRDNPGPYYYGSTVSLTAVPNPGYKFVNWTGTVNSTAATVNLIVNGNISTTAVFEKITYTLTVTTDGDGSGSVAKVPDKATYSAGEVVKLTATPAQGSKFVKWNVDGQERTENPTNVTVG